MDAGLQIERTTLSWRRTFLSGSVLLAGILKTNVTPLMGWDTVILLLGAFALLTLLATYGRTQHVYSRFILADSLRKGDTEQHGGTVSVMPWGWAGALTAVLSGAGIMALLAILVDFFS